MWGVIHTLALANALHGLGHAVYVYALDKDRQGFDYPLQCVSQLVPAQPSPLSTDAPIAQRIQEFVTHLQQCDRNSTDVAPETTVFWDFAQQSLTVFTASRSRLSQAAEDNPL
jgi:hypothetical protein